MQRTRVTGVGVRLCGAFCDFQIAFVGHLIQGVLAAREELAGIAVAAIISLTFYVAALRACMDLTKEYGPRHLV